MLARSGSLKSVQSQHPARSISLAGFMFKATAKRRQASSKVFSILAESRIFGCIEIEMGINFKVIKSNLLRLFKDLNGNSANFKGPAGGGGPGNFRLVGIRGAGLDFSFTSNELIIHLRGQNP